MFNSIFTLQTPILVEERLVLPGPLQFLIGHMDGCISFEKHYKKVFKSSENQEAGDRPLPCLGRMCSQDLVLFQQGPCLLKVNLTTSAQWVTWKRGV